MRLTHQAYHSAKGDGVIL